MAKKIMQFRWFSEGSEKNSPSARAKDYATGDIFRTPTNVFPITQLGIQGIPGTKFYLNGSVHPITIGVSGIYDLDIKNGMRVTALSFNEDSLERIGEDSNTYLIVDVLYGEEDDE